MSNYLSGKLDHTSPLFDPPERPCYKNFTEDYFYPRMLSYNLRSKCGGNMRPEYYADVYRRYQTYVRNLSENKITEEEIWALGEEKEALYREIYAPDVAPLPGFIDFVRSLKENHIKTAVATAAPKVNLDFLLEHIDLRNDFDVLIDDSEVDKGKPDPEIYLKAAERLGFSPELCLVFEDSLAGIQAAINAGIKVIGVTTTNPPENMQNTNLVIKDFTEINMTRITELMQEM